MVQFHFLRLPLCCRRLRYLMHITAYAGWFLALIAMLIALAHIKFGDFWLLLGNSPVTSKTHELMLEFGFVPYPILYPRSYHQSEDLPVFVAAINSEDLPSFHRFLGSFRLHFRERKLVVYDLGLTSRELQLVCT